MGWAVFYDPDYAAEMRDFDPHVQEAILSAIDLLECLGPRLGRPFVDTLKGSRFPNMKELRVVAAGQPWRVAFPFDPKRRAVILVAGSKAGKAKSVFYRRLIQTADRRFDVHLKEL